jgi:hypothetical protein
VGRWLLCVARPGLRVWTWSRFYAVQLATCDLRFVASGLTENQLCVISIGIGMLGSHGWTEARAPGDACLH